MARVLTERFAPREFPNFIATIIVPHTGGCISMADCSVANPLVVRL